MTDKSTIPGTNYRNEDSERFRAPMNSRGEMLE